MKAHLSFSIYSGLPCCLSTFSTSFSCVSLMWQCGGTSCKRPDSVKRWSLLLEPRKPSGAENTGTHTDRDVKTLTIGMLILVQTS